MTNHLDLGDSNHYFEFSSYKGEVSGGVALHNRPDNGTECVGGYISFTGRSWAREFNGHLDTWELVSLNPLTLSPSLLCSVCGDHGFIRDGKWVPA